MDKLLQNKCAIVTGGTAGIGKAIALKFAEQGAKVIIFGTHKERGAQAVAEIKQTTGNDLGTFYAVNVANKAEVEQVIKQILETHPQIDILVNNAGITRDTLLMKMTEKDWDDVMAINVKSCYNTSHALVRSMMKARQGKIINISSVVGLTGNAGQTNYAASKAAIIGFTKALAKEVASRNINVNCIAPGFIETGMTEILNTAKKDAALAGIPLGRMGTPTEIAHTALFLASSMADYITGQVITIDGGMVM
jgi:3-oxoacyl-[acyl-carrier protein] reductase